MYYCQNGRNAYGVTQWSNRDSVPLQILNFHHTPFAEKDSPQLFYSRSLVFMDWDTDQIADVANSKRPSVVHCINATAPAQSLNFLLAKKKIANFCG